MLFFILLISLMGGIFDVSASSADADQSRCAHGSQFISLCTNKPTTSISSCKTNFSVGVDVFLQDIMVTVSTVEVGSPVVINLAVTSTLTAPNACATDITTDELRVWDNLGATYFSNLYDYEVLRANRSIFPTFGGENILTSTDGQPSIRFGASVALSGDSSTLVIGAPRDNGLTGAVYIYQKQVTSWSPVLIIPDPVNILNDSFGAVVAISEDQSTIVISAQAGAGGLPAVYIYNYDPVANQATLLQTIQVATASTAPNLAVSASGEYIVIADNANPPHVFVYVRQNSACSLGTAWSLQQTLATQAGPGGATVAISPDGTVIAIGLPAISVPPNQGIVYIYTNENYSNQSNAWIFKQTVVSSDIASGDGFGSAVALSNNGKYLLVGADFKGNGQAYEFVRRGQSWLQENIFLPTGGGSHFGSSIGISGDGTVALFGAAIAGFIGNVYIAFRSPDNTWQQPFIFTGHTATAAFGVSVALSADGAFAAVGAPDAGGVTAGSVSMFSPIGSMISSDAIITGSLCVYNQTNVNGDLFVGGSIFTNGFVVAGAVAPCTPSDYRIKKNIQPLTFEKAWSQLKKLRPVTFTWKNPELHKDEGLRPGGFIAQEVAEHYPHWIRYITPKGADAAYIPQGESALHLAISPEILAYLIAVIQELHADDVQQRDMLHKLVVETTVPASSKGVRS